MKNGLSVNAVVAAEDDDTENDTESADESVTSIHQQQIWQRPRRPLRLTAPPTTSTTTFEHTNTFDIGENDYDSDDDTSKFVSQIFCRTSTMPRNTVKPKKRRAPKSIFLIKDFENKYEDEISILEQYFCSNVEQLTVPPPKDSPLSIVWAMIDSGSGPMIADCAYFFPNHKIR